MNPFIPCPFTYGDAPQGGSPSPMIVAARDPSNATDINYSPGYFWLSDLSQGGSGNLFVQGGFSAGSPAWTSVTAGALGALNTLSDGVTLVPPFGGTGNIALVSTPNQVTVTSNAPSSELIFSIPGVFIAPGSIASTTTIAAGTDLTVGGNATFANDISVTDDVTIGGDLTVLGAITLSSLTVAGTVELNVTGNANTSIGNPAGAGAILIDTPSGDLTINGNANDIHIGDDAAANHITIGSTTGAAGTIIQTGTDDLVLTGAVTAEIIIGSITQTGLITLGRSTAGENISIGDAINTGAQTISIGNGASGANSTVNILSGTGTAGSGVLALGNNPRVTTIGLGNVVPVASRTSTISGGTIITAVTDTLNLGTGGATTNAGAVKTVNLNTGGVTLGSVLTNIATGAVTSGTHTTAIATGNRAAGTMAVTLLTGTGIKTLTVGNADGLTTSTFLGPTNINASQNNNTAINSGTSTGTVTIGNSLAGAITVDTAAGISLDAATVSNFTVTGAGADLNLLSVGGSVLVESTENAALAIRLHANGGTSETIQLHADQGTGVASIGLLSDVGGLTLRAAANNTNDAINLEAPAGGIDVDATLQINIDSAQGAATAIQLISSGVGGGITLTGNTGGINLAGDVNLTSVATKITMNGGAVTDFIGTGTLIGGTLTIANTNIAAADRIMVTRSALNASPALGFLITTIVPATSFTVASFSATGVAVATDVSSFNYVIVRQT